MLVGTKPDRGHPEVVRNGRWSLRFDPVFTEAMKVVCDSIEQDANASFPAGPGEDMDWGRAFRVQMAYLLLWSIVERYATLAVGAGCEATERVKRLGRLRSFLSALHDVSPAPREVFDSRDPREKAVLNVESSPEKALQYYYAVRSNLSHRGKGAWHDAETVRRSLVELHTLMKGLLSSALSPQT